jgi:hypothetical protein
VKQYAAGGVIKRREKDRQREEAIAKVLATDLDHLGLRVHAFSTKGEQWEPVDWVKGVLDDERVKERWDQAKALNDQKARQKTEAARIAREEKEAREAAEKAAREAEKAAWEAEKAAWIDAHGSVRLKKAHVAGYPHNGGYAQERVILELGEDWVLDGKDDFSWKERNYPSEAALDLEATLKAQGRKAEIVWVTRAGDSKDVNYEAIIVHEFLDRYDVIKRIAERQ